MALGNDDTRAIIRSTPSEPIEENDDPSLAEGAVAVVFVALLSLVGLGLFALLLR
jgi:hypothetical protein